MYAILISFQVEGFITGHLLLTRREVEEFNGNNHNGKTSTTSLLIIDHTRCGSNIYRVLLFTVNSVKTLRNPTRGEKTEEPKTTQHEKDQRNRLRFVAPI